MKTLFTLFLLLFVISFNSIFIHAQSTNIKLPTSDGTSSFDVLKSNSTNVMTIRGNGFIGINQISPIAQLHINGNEGLLVTGVFASSSALNLGAGSRLHWYIKKSAFRVGDVFGNQWDDGNIGLYSIAMGKDVIASGQSSFSVGYFSTASGQYSSALGFGSQSTGLASVSLCYSNTASGEGSIATGRWTVASGLVSTAMGNSTTASGDYSTAMGYNVSTNSKTGAFIIGDYRTAPATFNSSADNEMTMRFSGGYRLYSNSNASIGVLLAADGNSWSAISDSDTIRVKAMIFIWFSTATDHWSRKKPFPHCLIISAAQFFLNIRIPLSSSRYPARSISIWIEIAMHAEKRILRRSTRCIPTKCMQRS